MLLLLPSHLRCYPAIASTTASSGYLPHSALSTSHAHVANMSELQGRKVFKVFNQEFIVDERYTVTKELGQGAYGIVWYARHDTRSSCTMT